MCTSLYLSLSSANHPSARCCTEVGIPTSFRVVQQRQYVTKTILKHKNPKNCGAWTVLADHELCRLALSFYLLSWNTDLQTTNSVAVKELKFKLPQ